MRTKFTISHPENLSENLTTDKDSVAVVMTHNYEKDREIMKFLLKQDLQYIGALGPKRRTEKLLGELKAEGFEFSDLNSKNSTLRRFGHRRGHAGSDRAFDRRGDQKRFTKANGRFLARTARFDLRAKFFVIKLLKTLPAKHAKNAKNLINFFRIFSRISRAKKIFV